MLTGIIGLLVTLLILSLLVLIHEFGHFITAKMFGIKVEEFGFGFPPKAWGKKFGETIYTINWLPIGGFVKLYGEDEAGGGKVTLKDPTKGIKDVDRAFFARPVWQRATVILAGVFMNAIVAFLVFYIFLFLSDFKTVLPLYSVDSTTTYRPQFSLVNQVTRPAGIYIEAVSANSPAAIAGLKAPAQIIALNNRELSKEAKDFEKELNSVIDTINKNKGKEISLTWLEVETGKTKTMKITPRVNVPKNDGALGIELNQLPMAIVLLNYESGIQRSLSGIVHPLNLMKYNFDIMGMLVRNAVDNKSVAKLSEGVSGPVGIVRLGSEINKIEDLKLRVMQFLNLAGLLSISLAVFNVLPIPALDGGRLFFILIEGLIGKKVSPKIEAAIHTVGMMVLMGLILLVTFKDIMQIFK